MLQSLGLSRGTLFSSISQRMLRLLVLPVALARMPNIVRVERTNMAVEGASIPCYPAGLPM